MTRVASAAEVNPSGTEDGATGSDKAQGGQMMKRYKNLSGDSGITSYEIRDNEIRLQFRDDQIYVYNSEKPGAEALEEIRLRAESGRGLSTYISQHIRDNYARKL